MIRNVLEQIGGVGIYGMISLILFFTFFIGMLCWVLRMRKPYVQEMSSMPLQSDD